jgi:hydrogenase-4 membrane subunit HyfE
MNTLTVKELLVAFVRGVALLLFGLFWVAGGYVLISNALPFTPYFPDNPLAYATPMLFEIGIVATVLWTLMIAISVIVSVAIRKLGSHDLHHNE